MATTIQERASGVLLTASDIAEWEADLEALATQRDAIATRMTELKQRIDVARHLAELVRPRAATPIATAPIEVAPVEVDYSAVPLPEAILGILKGAMHPLSNAQIRDELRKDPTQAARLVSSPNYYHTALKRLRDREQIVREGDRYRIAPTANESPSGFPAGDPDADEGATSSIESQDRFHDLLG